MTKKKEEQNEGLSKTGLAFGGISCMTTIALTALIGGFWGAEGFRTVGISIGTGIAVIIALLIMWANRD